MDLLFRIVCMIYAIYAITVISHPTKIVPFLAISCTIDAFRQAYVFSGNVLSIVGVTIYSYDIPVIVMAVIMILWKKQKHFYNIILPLTVVFLTIVYSTIKGLIEYGLNTYFLTDVRIFISLIVPILYFILYPVQFTDRDIRSIKSNLYILLGYSYFTWILRLTTGINLVPNEVQGGFRVFGSTTTFLMAVIALYLIYNELFMSGNKRMSLSTILLVIAVIIMQHNSVWAAFFVGLVLIVMFSKLERPGKSLRYIYNIKAFKQILILAMVIGLILTVWNNNPIMEAVTGSLDKYSQFGTGEGTIGARQTIWAGYISSIENISEWLLGKPFGTGWFINYYGVYSFSPPHNAYVEGIMRIGLIGTVALFGVLAYVAISALLKRKALIFSILLASFVYLYAYMFSWQMSMLWGILVGITCSIQKQNDDLKNPGVCLENERTYLL